MLSHSGRSRTCDTTVKCSPTGIRTVLEESFQFSVNRISNRRFQICDLKFKKQIRQGFDETFFRCSIQLSYRPFAWPSRIRTRNPLSPCSPIGIRIISRKSYQSPVNSGQQPQVLTPATPLPTDDCQLTTLQPSNSHLRNLIDPVVLRKASASDVRNQLKHMVAESSDVDDV